MNELTKLLNANNISGLAEVAEVDYKRLHNAFSMQSNVKLKHDEIEKVLNALKVTHKATVELLMKGKSL